MLPLNSPTSEQYFNEVTHQGKTITVGDVVLVPSAGQQKRVTVSNLVKSQGHYWVCYAADQKRCPWPLAKPV